MYLMYKDTPVMYYEVGVCKVLTPHLMPYALRDFMTTVNYTSIPDAINANDRFKAFCSRRTLTLSRKYAKKIFNAFDIDQDDSTDALANLAIKCSLLSVEDKYWICSELDEKRWFDVDLEQHRLNELMLPIALKGESITIAGDLECQELSTGGTFPKAWIRKDDGLYLLKHRLEGYEDGPLIEVCVSNILDKLNVPHVHYEFYKWNNLECSICKNMRTDTSSRVTTREVGLWALYTKKQLIDIAKSVDLIGFSQMLIVDYLISNSDRHSGNWGFLMDDTTGDLVSLHPLFDHNLAFDPRLMLDWDFPSRVIKERSMREVAREAVQQCAFKVPGGLTPEMFPSNTAYKSFMDKAEDLGVLK